MKNRIEILLVILVLFLTSCGGGRSKEVHTREEPYIDIVTETVKLTYDIEEGGLYWRRHNGYLLGDISPSMEIECMVTNTSEHGGTFTLYATMTSQGNEIAYEIEKFIGAGQTVTISEDKTINDFSFQANVKVERWGIIAPTKEIQKEVVKYRTIYY